MREYRPIKGRDVDGRHACSKAERREAHERRAELAALGVCINGVKHGARTHGVRCWRCALVYKLGRVKAEQHPLWPPPGTFTMPESSGEPIPCTPAGDCRTSQHRDKRGGWQPSEPSSSGSGDSSVSAGSTS